MLIIIIEVLVSFAIASYLFVIYEGDWKQLYWGVVFSLALIGVSFLVGSYTPEYKSLHAEQRSIKNTLIGYGLDIDKFVENEGKSQFYNFAHARDKTEIWNGIVERIVNYNERVYLYKWGYESLWTGWFYPEPKGLNEIELKTIVQEGVSIHSWFLCQEKRTVWNPMDLQKLLDLINNKQKEVK